jgi:chaperone modulatory protein CbpM
MNERDIIVAVALEDACLTLEQLCSTCALDAESVARWVDEGLFPVEGPRERWRFTSAQMLRAQRMHRIERDFEAVPELAALVADLLEEMDALRARLRREGFA